MLMTMTSLLAGCAALHIAPSRGVFKPVVARRAAVLVMDEEIESYSVPFTNVTAAVADIKEVLTTEGFSDAEEDFVDDEVPAPSAEDAARAAWLAQTYGDWSFTGQGVPVAVDASPPAMEELSDVESDLDEAKLAALIDENKELDDALMYGYDADKVKRLAEVEAILDEAGGAAPEASALSPEEAAKAKWLAARTRPSWGGNY